MQPVFEFFASNCHRDNTLNSAVLELVVFLSANFRFVLLKHVLDDHASFLEETEASRGLYRVALETLAEKNDPIGGNGAGGPSQIIDVMGSADAGNHLHDGAVGPSDRKISSTFPIDSHGHSSGVLFGSYDHSAAWELEGGKDHFSRGDDNMPSILDELRQIVEGKEKEVAIGADDYLLAGAESFGDDCHSIGAGGQWTNTVQGVGMDFPCKETGGFSAKKSVSPTDASFDFETWADNGNVPALDYAFMTATWRSHDIEQAEMPMCYDPCQIRLQEGKRKRNGSSVMRSAEDGSESPRKRFRVGYGS